MIDVQRRVPRPRRRCAAAHAATASRPSCSRPTAAPASPCRRTTRRRSSQTEVLKQGNGETVEDGDARRRALHGRARGTTTPSSTRRGRTARRPRSSSARATTAQVIPGFSKALIGQQVGSQIGVIVPPSEGYGDQGNAQVPAGLDAVLRDRHPGCDLSRRSRPSGRPPFSMIAPVSGASRKGEPRIPVEDRLFSLVLALLATEAGLLKAEILSSVRGYAERYDDSGQNANLERQFERDKDDIRELGIPLETVESPDRPGDNQALRYRIPKGQYDLPDEVRFTPDELALLGLAAEVWREASLSADSQRALTKLRSLGIEPREPVIGYAPAAARARCRVRAAAAGARPSAVGALPLLQARRGRAARAHGRSARRRAARGPLAPARVRPRRAGSAHLPALPHRRPGRARARHDVRRAAGRHPGPHPRRARRAPAAERRPTSRSPRAATPRCGSASARCSRDEDAGVIRLHYTDAAVFADELAAYGPEVRVIAPASLREAVRERLAAVVAAHRDGGAA